MNKLTFLIAVLISLSFGSLSGQSNDSNPNYLWKAGANIGSSLLWGDVNSNGSPFTRWFSNESSFTYGMTIQRKLSNTFWLQGGLQKGLLSGSRSSWSGDAAHAVINAKSSFLDYHLGLNVDFTSLFGFKPDRLISIYGFGGFGMTHYNAQSYSDGVLYKDLKGYTPMIPAGGGLTLRLNERWSLYGETNWRITFSDEIDAYAGSGTVSEDIYSITGVGVLYTFGPKKEKKPRIEVTPTPVEPEVAKVFVPANVSQSTNLPTEVQSNSEYLVTNTINKDTLKGKGEYSLGIPEDFYLSNVQSNGGKVTQDSTRLTITWDELPTEPIILSYKLTTGGLDKENYNMSGSFSYAENNENKVKTFNNRVNLKSDVVAQNQNANQNANPVTANPTNTNQQSIEVGPLTKAGLEYRVQVAAVFGGTTSKRLLQKRLGLTDEIYEDSYKNSYRYTVGSFQKYSEAVQHAALSKVNGAYVVVFKDGKYIGQLENVNDDIKDTDGVKPSGTTYKVQIAASKGRPYSIAKLAYKYGVEETDVTEDKIGDWFQYSVGTFNTMDEAKSLLSTLKVKLPEAYIIKFVDGNRSK